MSRGSNSYAGPIRLLNVVNTVSIEVPAPLAELTVLREGEAGRAWLAALPGLVDRLCEEWRLQIDGPPRHGGAGLITPVSREADRYALKVSWPNAEVELEIRALSAWAGHGTVRLVDERPADGACLLDWIDSDRTLADVPIDKALTEAARLIRRLAIPAPPGFPRLSELTQEWLTTQDARSARLGGVVPGRALARVREACTELGPTAAEVMVNRDLHYENVVDGGDSWVVVDPKPVVGDPEFALAPLLWRRLEETGGQAGLDRRLRRLLDGAGLDERRARGWILLYTVDYWLWGLEVGLTEDPVRCGAIVDWLLE
ncbi:MAG: aminoglycoside phosphotransferase family protein [Actinomycetota bacterium]|nr:aminoglycoside phosphotransferase family protein [Actinomycetota bacterium]